MSKQYQNLSDFSEITLNEGDILYHPAGVWHAVSCEEDSISINFSMKALRMGEFVTQAVQGEIFKNLNQRQFLRFETSKDLSKSLSLAFSQLEKAAKKYKNNPLSLVPMGMLIPKVCRFDLDAPLESQCGMNDIKKLPKHTKFRLNDQHIVQMIKVDDFSQLPADIEPGVKYIIHSHFTNQDQNNIDFQSTNRVFIYTSKDLDWILEQEGEF